MNNTAVKYNFVPKDIKIKETLRARFKSALKNELLNNDRLMLKWVDEFSEWEPSILEGIVAYPMGCFTDEAEFYAKKHGVAWFCERIYTGAFNPYDDYFMTEPYTGDIISFKTSEYLEWLRRKDHFDRILEALESYTVDYNL